MQSYMMYAQPQRSTEGAHVRGTNPMNAVWESSGGRDHLIRHFYETLVLLSLLNPLKNKRPFQRDLSVGAKNGMIKWRNFLDHLSTRASSALLGHEYRYS
jgi:hypothetical protein